MWMDCTSFSTSRYVVLRSGKILAFAIAVALLFRQYGIYKQQMSLEQVSYLSHF